MREVIFYLDTDSQRTPHKGVFHQYSLTGFNGDINTVAIIEDEQGGLREVLLKDFRFTPLKPISKKEIING